MPQNKQIHLDNRPTGDSTASNFKLVGTQPGLRYDSVVLALFVAFAVSLIFGLYPANRAASMRPIDALRHE